VSSVLRLEGKGTLTIEGKGRLGHRPRLDRSARGDDMEDQRVLDRINELADEEHLLYEKESRGEADDAERSRLRDLEVTLDQCWDLLRQRRARRDAGMDPDQATVRDERTVEGYLG
jgi:Protein of unknown function (DUF2630)